MFFYFNDESEFDAAWSRDWRGGDFTIVGNLPVLNFATGGITFAKTSDLIVTLPHTSKGFSPFHARHRAQETESRKLKLANG